MKTVDRVRCTAHIAATSVTASLKACTTSVVAAATRRDVRSAGLQACLTAALMTAFVAPAAPGASPVQPPQTVPYGSLVEVTDEATRAAAAGVDLTGEWAPRFHEDQPERVPGPELGDYLGIPLNLAARMRGEVWEASIQTLWEWQCRPHSADYIWRGPSPVRIWKEVDPVSRQVIAWHAEWLRSVDRQIYMDGRPHPSASAPHTWSGFSTGRWEGDRLTVKTTHLKEGYVRRNGVPRSDQATLTEHWMLHDDVLTVATIVYDPVYLTEPFIRTTDYERDLHQQNPPYPCAVVEEVDRPKGTVPHKLPGATNFVTDFAKRCGIPVEAARGGAETMYPEYKSKLPGTAATCVAAPR